MKISLVTPYRCSVCGYESNNQDQVKFHMKAWVEEHKVIRAKSKRNSISIAPLRTPSAKQARSLRSKQKSR